jgi:hypothetical protein
MKFSILVKLTSRIGVIVKSLFCFSVSYNAASLFSHVGRVSKCSLPWVLHIIITTMNLVGSCC